MSTKLIGRRRALSFGGAALPFLLASCGGAASPANTGGPTAASGAGSTTSAAPTSVPAPVPDREVVIAVSRDLANGPQDPFFAHSSPMVWEPLVGLDDALKPLPVLAQSWSLSDDAKTWTFKLRPNVLFSDGTPFDADAVVKNMQRYMKISPRPSPYTAMDLRVGYGRLADVKKVDATTVQFVSEDPNPTMVNTMTNFFSAMFQPALFAENGDFTGNPISTGPYTMKEWKRGEYLLLERNDKYWGPKPAVKTVRLRVIADANARVSSIIAKEVDGIAELGALLPAQAQQLKGQPGITVGADPISITQYIAFNCAKPPFDDVRLRRAVAFAIDRDSIVKDLVLGYGTPGKSLLSPISTQWYSPKGNPKYSMADAQRLAKEALGDKRVSVTFPFSTSAGQARPYKQIGELLQQVLRPLGIDVNLQGLEAAALTDQSNRGDWGMQFYQLGWANGDPDFIFSRFMKSGAILTGTAQAGYVNAQADQLINAGKIERDEKKRFAIYEQLQELSVTEQAVTVLYHELAPYASRDTLSGLKQRANFQPTLDTMKLVK
jgi:peptide/nickel transport system substrate-binding protein